jgi:hypothetical protein
MYGRHLLPLAFALVPLTVEANTFSVARIPTEHAALVEFTEAVNRYVNMHRLVTASLPPAELCADPEQIQRQTEELSRAIRIERATAAPGEVFTPAAAELFRRRIAAAELLLGDGSAVYREGEMPAHDRSPLEVNGPFPWIGGFEIMTRIEVALPPLPEELAYRVIDRDLVLLDVGANLIVDILHDALPVDRPAPEPVTPGGPCAVHPMCWS